VESLDSVTNIEEIAAVDGIDMLFIGPLDLSGSAGELGNYTNPTFVDALARAEQVVGESNKLLGGIPRPDDSPLEMFARGYNLVVSSSDALLLRDAALNDLLQNTPR
jgi:4-hydroxy-2-oxoheptanedioate aldolase